MTVATLITIFRLILTPVYGFIMGYYNCLGGDTQPDQSYRIAALCVFLIASMSDAFDGLVARYFNQKSRLGAWLDPLADKLLSSAALISLSLSTIKEQWRFPLWFTVLMISKDIIILLGFLIFHATRGDLKVRPNLAGKISTTLLFVLIVGALGRPGWLQFDFLVKVTALTAVIALFLYLRELLVKLGSRP